MTKKHFEAIAALLDAKRDTTIGVERDVVEDLANDLANFFIGENPRFDQKRFLTACGF